MWGRHWVSLLMNILILFFPEAQIKRGAFSRGGPYLIQTKIFSSESAHLWTFECSIGGQYLLCTVNKKPEGTLFWLFWGLAL